jgi:hypothetical protein
VQLLDCTPSLAGAKASACARLEQVRDQRAHHNAYQCTPHTQ